MDIRVEQQIFIYNEAIADSVITDEEKRKLEKAGITDEIIRELNNKTQEEMVDILECRLKEQTIEEDLPWYKQLWNYTSPVLGGILGGLAGLAIGSRTLNCVRNTKIGGLAGLTIGIGLGILSQFNKHNIAENASNTQDNSVEIERTEAIAATTMTIGENDEHDPITLSNNLGISYSRLKLVNPNLDLTRPFENGMEVNIPERKVVKPGTVTNIAEAADAAGVSKEYVEDILFRIEGKNGIAAKKPYDDEKETINNNGYPVPIKGREKRKNGTLTIGFGHTGRVFDQIMTRKNRNEIEISNNQAYEILAADIISAKADAEEYYGKAFTNAPQSIQDAIVDIIFNKGLEKGMGFEKFEDCKKQTLTPQIKKCLENEDYAGCVSKLIYNTGLRGLHKRNYYRLISSMRDLSAEDRQKAMNDIKYYYNKVCKLYKGNRSELNHIKDAWENAQNGICNNFMN